MSKETAGLIPGPDPDLDPAERRLLAAMPLHAITSVHGQAGLRERLLLEIERIPAADRDRAQDALALACQLHAADRRQREPYANHLLRVAIRILSHYRGHRPLRGLCRAAARRRRGPRRRPGPRRHPAGCPGRAGRAVR